MTAWFGTFKRSSKRSSHQQALVASLPRFLILSFLCLGIALRLFHIDHKLYWGDEVATSVRVSGYTFAQATAQLTEKSLFTVDELQQYQYPNGEETSAFDTVRSLIQEDPHHPPLYFLLTRAWVSVLSPSVKTIRALSVVFSLLTLPAIYWLCQELFRKPIVGEMAMVLASVSPLYVIYAQEAVQYSLWLFLIVVSSAVLVRATRLQQRRWLLGYGVTVLLGLYTHVFFGAIILGQALYVLCSERLLGARRWLGGFSASVLATLGLAIAGFMPWLFVWLYRPHSESLALDRVLSADSAELPGLLLRWLGILTRTFIDLGISPLDMGQLGGPFVGVLASMASALLGLVVYGFYHLNSYPQKAPRTFLICLLVATILPLVGVYLFLGKQLFVTRYILPVSLLLQLLMAFVLAKKLSLTRNRFKRQLWKVVVVFVIACSIFSCAVRIPALIWWNQVPALSSDLPAIAQTINQSEQPLVLSNGEETITFFMLQTLGHLVAPKTHFQWLEGSKTELTRERFQSIFLIDPSGQLVDKVEAHYQRRARLIGQWTWQLESN